MLWNDRHFVFRNKSIGENYSTNEDELNLNGERTLNDCLAAGLLTYTKRIVSSR